MEANTDSVQDTQLSSLQAQLIDVRSPAEFASGHIPKAINIPLEEISQRLDDIESERPVVLICESGNRAGMAKQGHFANKANVAVLEGGTKGWREAGRKLVGASGSATIPIMRQVQIGAGSTILLGFLLSLLVSPYWLVLPIFVGGGLLFAGISGYCGMAMLLQKMPWNRSTCK